MFPYVFLLLTIFLWVFAFKKQLNIKEIFIPLIILVVFATVRDVTIGTDSEMYSRVFSDNIDVNNFVFDVRLETGYQALTWLIMHIDKEYYLLFFFTSLIIVFNNLYAIKKYSQDFILSIYIYIAFGFYTFFFNTLRQAIAMSILMLGIKYLLNKNLLKYVAVIAIAFLFHRSAIVMLPLFMIIHYVKLRVEYKAMICFMFSFLVASIILEYMANINEKYSSYVEESEKSGGYSYIILYSLIAFSLLFLGKKIRETNLEYRVYEQIYICGVALCVPLIFLGTDPSGPKRVIYYFLAYLVFILPIFFKYYKNIYLKLYFYILCFIYFVYITYNIWGVYPYVINPIFEIF